MVQLTMRQILLSAISTIIGALITGYFFAVGEDLWQRTKEGAPILPNLWNPFWFISVPLGIIGILLLIYDIYLQKRKPRPQPQRFRLTTKTVTMNRFAKLRKKLGFFRKPKHNFTSFDDSFKAVQDTPEPKAKARMLDYFQPELRSLCYDYQWDEVKDRIQKVLEYIIPKTLSNDPNVLSHLQYLAMIINRYSEHTIDVVREKWLKELEMMYDDPKYETNCSFLGMLQELHGYSTDYMIKLIDDSATRWSDARFQSLAPNIEFWELKRRDEGIHQIILQYLRRKMSDAERSKEDKAFERLKFLYGRARG